MLMPWKPKGRAITQIKETEEGIFLYSETGMYRLTAKTPATVRITYTEKREFEREEKPGIVNHATAACRVSETDTEILFKTERVIIRINRETASFTYCDSDGGVLLRERVKKSRELEEFPVYKLDENGAVQKEKIETADGVKEVIRSAAKIQDGSMYHTRLHLTWQEGEMLFGLGQHEEGFLNLRGKAVYVHQANRKIAVPMLVSSLGYGILTDTYSPMIFRDDAYGSFIYTEADREMDHYFIYGGEMEGVIREYRMLTGKAAMLPKWAFGYIQSQERYETQEEILSMAKEYHARGLGLDALVLDWCSWEDGMWGQKSFDPKRFPDPEKMTRTLHEDGVHFMISIWPNMSEECENYKEFKERGLLLAGSNIYNALSEEGRKLYWQQADKAFYQNGVDAWWCDSSEPVTPEWNHLVRPDVSAMYAEFCQNAGNHLPPDMLNAYCLFHARALYEGQRGAQTPENAGSTSREQTPGNAEAANRVQETAASEQASRGEERIAEKRVCNLTRSGYTGQQRYGTILWSGDIAATWDTYRRQIAAGLGFCASGLPYWTVDIGAFFVKRGVQWYWEGDYDKTNDDPAYRELFVRWYQWGCFLPVFRGHGTDCKRELWAFGDAGDPHYEALAAANHLRYRLMPYIYARAGLVWLEDVSMIGMLAFSFADDAQALAISDQYMFGGAIMVCPVTQPMDAERAGAEATDAGCAGNGAADAERAGNGATDAENAGNAQTRRVYLPNGCGWYDFWTERYYEGGQWIEADAPLDRIPLFVREGSIIPMQEPVLSTDAAAKEIELCVYAGKDCAYTFYEDAGDGYGYERGEYALTVFLWDDAKQELQTDVKQDRPEHVQRAAVKNVRVIRCER